MKLLALKEAVSSERQFMLQVQQMLHEYEHIETRLGSNKYGSVQLSFNLDLGFWSTDTFIITVLLLGNKFPYHDTTKKLHIDSDESPAIAEVIIDINNPRMHERIIEAFLKSYLSADGYLNRRIFEQSFGKRYDCQVPLATPDCLQIIFALMTGHEIEIERVLWDGEYHGRSIEALVATSPKHKQVIWIKE